jgi:hypothetical protein
VRNVGGSPRNEFSKRVREDEAAGTTRRSYRRGASSRAKSARAEDPSAATAPLQSPPLRQKSPDKLGTTQPKSPKSSPKSSPKTPSAAAANKKAVGAKLSPAKIDTSPSKDSELKALRKALRDKEDETRRLVVATRKEMEESLRSAEGRLKSSTSPERERNSHSQEDVQQAISVVLLRAERQQREAVRQAVADATAKLMKKHKMELDAIREEEEKRIEIARIGATRQMTVAHQKAMSTETAMREAAEEELVFLRQASTDVTAARSEAEAARLNMADAFDQRQKMEAHMKEQVRPMRAAGQRLSTLATCAQSPRTLHPSLTDLTQTSSVRSLLTCSSCGPRSLWLALRRGWRRSGATRSLWKRRWPS